ncbi:MAG: T9SS type A sorting domain-containing protein [Bacteroidetes bacterium]|nr:T9SS type A sorting domain-containing protein [Bacteroidota bacterium]
MCVSKKLLFFLLLLPVFVSAQVVNIPDANFKAYLVGYPLINTNGDGEIQVTEATAFTGGIYVGLYGISDLTGIEAFTALTTLYCYGNSLPSLDVSQNTALTTLQCHSNSLPSLDVSNNTALTELYCYKNSLTGLDVSSNTALTYLSCGSNSLTSLDVSSNTALTGLSCRWNSLTGLDVSNNTALTHLYCYSNSLTVLDVSNNTALIVLACGNNPLTGLDVSMNTALIGLYCGINSLTVLDVSNNTALTELHCYYNSLTNLDISNNTALTELYCYVNFLTSLDVSNNTALTVLRCSSNSLTGLDVSSNTALTSLWCYENSLTGLDIRNGNNVNMWGFDATNNPNLYCIAVDDPWYSSLNWPLNIKFQIDIWAQYTSGVCGDNKISGVAYYDANQNCARDSGEQGLPRTIVKATGPFSMVTVTNDTGYYELWVDSNTAYQINMVADTNWGLYNGSCPNTGYSINSGADGTITPNIDFGLDLKLCALPSVDVSLSRLRRCFTNNATITYRNDGTMDQLNAGVYVDFPEYVKLVWASESFSVVDATKGIYKFNIDTIHAFSKGTISIIDSVICGNEDIRGYTQCIRTWITPVSTCAETKDTTAWDKSSIMVTDAVECIGDSIARFIIINSGDGDMVSTHDYRIYYDNELAHTGSFQLKSGDGLKIEVTADGSTIRLEADQHPLHPGNSRPRTTGEGCGSATPATASLGFWPQSANDDLDFDVSEICLEIRDSYDPNDKRVTPSGITTNNYVPENEPLNYTIRFQNTGSAMAYKIIVVDTLSDQLDLSTLSIGGASHDFTYEVLGTDVTVLAFTFDNVNLPDSTTNEPGSHGFVSFTISPTDNITPGTPIENFGDIYFDFNSSIRTDTASVIALDTTISSSKSITVTEVSIPIGISESEALGINIFPNPASDYITIQGTNKSFNQVRIYDAIGRVAINQSISTNQAQVDVRNLGTGVYFIHVLNDRGQSYIFKMVKK